MDPNGIGLMKPFDSAKLSNLCSLDHVVSLLLSPVNDPTAGPECDRQVPRSDPDLDQQHRACGGHPVDDWLAATFR